MTLRYSPIFLCLVLLVLVSCKKEKKIISDCFLLKSDYTVNNQGSTYLTEFKYNGACQLARHIDNRINFVGGSFSNSLDDSLVYVGGVLKYAYQVRKHDGYFDTWHEYIYQDAKVKEIQYHSITRDEVSKDTEVFLYDGELLSSVETYREYFIPGAEEMYLDGRKVFSYYSDNNLDRIDTYRTKYQPDSTQVYVEVFHGSEWFADYDTGNNPYLKNPLPQYRNRSLSPNIHREYTRDWPGDNAQTTTSGYSDYNEHNYPVGTGSYDAFVYLCP